MKVRLANLIFDETSRVLANGEIKPVFVAGSVNRAKAQMRGAVPAKAFEAWRELGARPHEALIKLTGAKAPPAALADGTASVQLTPGEVEILRAQAADRAEFNADNE